MRRGAFAWSVRRELWEHRSIFLAPLAIAGLVLVAFFYKAGAFAAAMASLGALPPAKQAFAAVMPYSLAASAILVTGWIVGIFYCLDALNGERRDRSILFWKSMPVSDTTTVLSKVFIPAVVIPVIVCVVAIAAQAVMLAVHSAILLAKGIDLGELWRRLPVVQMPVAMVYGMVAHTLWFAPIIGWLLLVSAWSRRATFAWAFLPFLAAFAFESIAFGTSYVSQFLRYRVTGATAAAFKADASKEPITQIAQLDPLKFLATPGLWWGLVLAAVLVAAAIRLRRHREPI